MSILLCVLLLFNQTGAIDTTNITFDFKDADVRDVLRAIGIQAGVNIVVDQTVEGNITVHLENVGLEDGLRMMLEANGFSLEKEVDYYLVKKLAKPRGRRFSKSTLRIELCLNMKIYTMKP